MTTATTSYQADTSLKLCDAPVAIKLRDHQLAAWDRMSGHFLGEDGRKAGLIVVPTGGGKTVIAAHWLLEHHLREGGRVLW